MVYWGGNICNRKLGCLGSFTHFLASCLVKQINNYLVGLKAQFSKLRKATFSFATSVCPSARIEQLVHPTEDSFMKFYI